MRYTIEKWVPSQTFDRFYCAVQIGTISYISYKKFLFCHVVPKIIDTKYIPKTVKEFCM